VTKTYEEFRQAFQLDQLTVYKNGGWTWSVRPQQPTLGASVISLNRFAGRLSDMTAEEAADFRDVVVTAETTLRQVFGYQKINYLMLMMVDAHVHYHVIPRYDAPQSFNEVEFIDAGWPKQPDLGTDNADGRADLLAAIAEALRTGL